MQLVCKLRRESELEPVCKLHARFRGQSRSPTVNKVGQGIRFTILYNVASTYEIILNGYVDNTGKSSVRT